MYNRLLHLRIARGHETIGCKEDEQCSVTCVHVQSRNNIFSDQVTIIGFGKSQQCRFELWSYNVDKLISPAVERSVPDI